MELQPVFMHPLFFSSSHIPYWHEKIWKYFPFFSLRINSQEAEVFFELEVTVSYHLQFYLTRVVNYGK